jgi:hypothetical protein
MVAHVLSGGRVRFLGRFGRAVRASAWTNWILIVSGEGAPRGSSCERGRNKYARHGTDTSSRAGETLRSRAVVLNCTLQRTVSWTAFEGQLIPRGDDTTTEVMDYDLSKGGTPGNREGPRGCSGARVPGDEQFVTFAVEECNVVHISS